MPRHPPGLRYREAIAALQDASRNIRTVLVIPRLPLEARTLLQLLADRLELLLSRDNGRSQ